MAAAHLHAMAPCNFYRVAQVEPMHLCGGGTWFAFAMSLPLLPLALESTAGMRHGSISILCRAGNAPASRRDTL